MMEAPHFFRGPFFRGLGNGSRVALLAALVLGTPGCGSSDEKPEEPAASVADPSAAAEEPPPPTDGPFHELPFDEALSWAEKAERPVIVDFFTTWCGPCKVLDRTTWKDPDVVRWLTEHTIALKLDAERETELAERYGIRAYPTVLVLDADGTERRRLLGLPQIEQWVRKRLRASG